MKQQLGIPTMCAICVGLLVTISALGAEEEQMISNVSNSCAEGSTSCPDTVAHVVKNRAKHNVCNEAVQFAPPKMVALAGAAVSVDAETPTPNKIDRSARQAARQAHHQAIKDYVTSYLSAHASDDNVEVQACVASLQKMQSRQAAMAAKRQVRQDILASFIEKNPPADDASAELTKQNAPIPARMFKRFQRIFKNHQANSVSSAL